LDETYWELQQYPAVGRPIVDTSERCDSAVTAAVPDMGGSQVDRQLAAT